MWEQIELSQGVKVRRHPPADADLAALHRDGVRAVIDVRTGSEAYGVSLPPTEEAASARANGLEAIHVPIDFKAVTKADLDRIGAALHDAPKPVLIHCASGKRAGMAALVHTAIASGASGAEMLEMARTLDLVFGDAVQQRVFADYVDEHRLPPDRLVRREEALRVDGQPVPLVPEAVREVTRTVPAWRRSPPADPVVGLPLPGFLGGGELSGRSLAILAVAGAAALMLFDRHLRLPLLIAAGIIGARAVTRLQSRPSTPVGSEDPALDVSVAELDARIRHLKATA